METQNNKPTAMQSQSMARSQCWTTVSIRTRSLININSWRLVYRLTIQHPQHAHSIIQNRWCLSTLIANSVEKIGISHPPHCIVHKPLWWPQLDVLAFWAANQIVYWLSVSPGRWGWTWVRITQQAFFQGWLLPVLLTSGALSDPVHIDTLIHWMESSFWFRGSPT